jgi:transposase
MEEDEMLTETTRSPATRFVALNVHRQYLMIGAVDVQQQVVLSPRRFGFEAIALVGTSPFDPY